MSENLCTDGDCLLILFESAAKRYRDHFWYSSADPVDRIYRMKPPAKIEKPAPTEKR